jgi:hypothetical protein
MAMFNIGCMGGYPALRPARGNAGR